VPLGAPDHASFGFLLAPKVTWPCGAGTQKAYCPGIAAPGAAPSTVTVRAAAAAAPGSSSATAIAPSKDPLSSDIASSSSPLRAGILRRGIGERETRALPHPPVASMAAAHWPSAAD